LPVMAVGVLEVFGPARYGDPVSQQC
jgi:hypothetical protein